MSCRGIWGEALEEERPTEVGKIRVLHIEQLVYEPIKAPTEGSAHLSPDYRGSGAAWLTERLCISGCCGVAARCRASREWRSNRLPPPEISGRFTRSHRWTTNSTL
jgi:hypothetical protein